MQTVHERAQREAVDKLKYAYGYVGRALTRFQSVASRSLCRAGLIFNRITVHGVHSEQLGEMDCSALRKLRRARLPSLWPRKKLRIVGQTSEDAKL
jgi:hypothetical protein